MSFLESLETSSPVAHDLLILSGVIVSGLALGQVRIAGVRLGVAGVLFTGLAAAHAGMEPRHEVAHFLKDFGLVLFVFALGMQMGPGFFASLRRQGRVLNMYAAALVLGGAGLACAGGALLGLTPPIVAGLFAGASTNTPALGAAQQALESGGAERSVVGLAALSYAATYPLAIVAIILSLVLLRLIFKIDVPAEAEQFRKDQGEDREPLERMHVRVQNPNLAGTRIGSIPGLQELGVVVSRHRAAGEEEVRMATPSLRMGLGDVLLAVGTRSTLEQFQRVVGTESSDDLVHSPGPVARRSVVLTNRRLLGKSVRELGMDHVPGVTITRIGRGDLSFTARPDVRLQFGDVLRLVGEAEVLAEATRTLGNAVRKLEETTFAAIFAGILAGVLVGLYPLRLEGLPAPVRLGLAGGPLMVAILLSHLGRVGPLVMHMPLQANRALRELGIMLFLANVGLLSGGSFVATVFTPQGAQWVLLGLAVTLLPLLVVGVVARKVHRMNYMALSGLLSGGMTDPPALAFATAVARCDSPAVAYAAVYPLTMLLRIVAAQVIAQLQ
jgi:putative transport protein